MIKVYVPAMLLIFTVSLVLFKAEIPLKKSVEKETKNIRRKFLCLYCMTRMLRANFVLKGNEELLQI